MGYQHLILTRLWNCAEARDCDRCANREKCRQLKDIVIHKQLSAADVENFLADFQQLISENNSQGY